ncbi:MAG: hypothetical protein M1358_03825 [Chloroflexi bacterium]|nr:hypothetical protein [Chloroflexota bacterium]
MSEIGPEQFTTCGGIGHDALTPTALTEAKEVLQSTCVGINGVRSKSQEDLDLEPPSRERILGNQRIAFPADSGRSNYLSTPNTFRKGED